MNAQAVAVIIAGALTLIGTLAAQYLGYQATSRNAQKALAEQGEQLDRTLTEQHWRTRYERFATAVGHLGDDKPAAVRLAGVYAMAGLADDWPQSRQTCVNVLCAYLRLPYKPDPGEEAPEPERFSYQATREIRHTIIRVITAHLQDGAEPSWQGLHFDLNGVVFDGGDFTGAEFSSGAVDFTEAKFSSGTVRFVGAEFSGGIVGFVDAEFSGGTVDFLGAKFSGAQVSFGGGEFSGGEVDFSQVANWTHPPEFYWDDLPLGVKLPAQPANSPADETPGDADRPRAS
jgi:hypothetical protein